MCNSLSAGNFGMNAHLVGALCYKKRDYPLTKNYFTLVMDYACVPSITISV